MTARTATTRSSRRSRTAGRSVLIAGSTVVIAVLGLVLTGLPYMYGVAISASMAVLVVMLAAVTLLPALLSYLGPNVDRLRIPFLGRTAKTEGGEESIAGRWSHAVQRRPWTAVIVGTAVLLALAAPALGMRLGFPDAGNDPPDTMTRQAYDLISEGFGPGANGPVVIAAELPDPAARGDVDGSSTALQADQGVDYVAKPRFNESGEAALINVIPTTSPQDEATQDLVKRIRDDIVPDDAGRLRRQCRGRGRDARRSRTRASTWSTACRSSSPASSASPSCSS